MMQKAFCSPCFYHLAVFQKPQQKALPKPACWDSAFWGCTCDTFVYPLDVGLSPEYACCKTPHTQHLRKSAEPTSALHQVMCDVWQTTTRDQAAVPLASVLRSTRQEHRCLTGGGTPLLQRQSGPQTQQLHVLRGLPGGGTGVQDEHQRSYSSQSNNQPLSTSISADNTQRFAGCKWDLRGVYSIHHTALCTTHGAATWCPLLYLHQIDVVPTCTCTECTRHIQCCAAALSLGSHPPNSMLWPLCAVGMLRTVVGQYQMYRHCPLYQLDVA